MNRTLALIAASVVVTSTGCLGLKPVGPMADFLGKPAAPTKPAPGVTVTAPKDAPSGGPVLQPPPAPPQPAILVSPGEVTQANFPDSIEKLKEEMRSDRQAMDAMPRYAEVSTIPGRR